MSVSWCLWTGWRVDASPCRQMGRTGSYRGVGGAQVDPEGRAPGILQLGVRPWGLPGLSLPALCPARPWTLCTGVGGGCWSNSLCGLAGPGRGPRETRGPSPGVSGVLGSESLGRAAAWAPQGGAWGRPSTRPPLSLSVPSQAVQPDLEEAGGLPGAGEGARLRGDCRQDAGEDSLWRRPRALWVSLLPRDQVGPPVQTPVPPHGEGQAARVPGWEESACTDQSFGGWARPLLPPLSPAP